MNVTQIVLVSRLSRLSESFLCCLSQKARITHHHVPDDTHSAPPRLENDDRKTKRHHQALNDSTSIHKRHSVLRCCCLSLASILKDQYGTKKQQSSCCSIIMTQASNGNGDNRPSSARRIGLREADAGSGSVPMVSNFFPIERYYDAADKVRLRRNETRRVSSTIHSKLR